MYAEMAGLTVFSARRSAWWRRPHDSGDLIGESRSPPSPDELLRERRQAARVRHLPPVVHPQRRPRRRSEGRSARCAHRARTRAACHPDVHGVPLPQLGRGPGTAIGSISRQRFFGVPFPVWYAVGEGGEVALRHSVLTPGLEELPIDPHDRRAGRIHRGAAEPAGRLRRRPRHPRHLGHLLADPAQLAGGWNSDPGLFRHRVPDGCAAAGPRHHPAPGCSPPSCDSPPSRTPCRGSTPRSTAGSWTRTARRCPSPRATWSPRSGCSSSTSNT